MFPSHAFVNRRFLTVAVKLRCRGVGWWVNSFEGNMNKWGYPIRLQPEIEPNRLRVQCVAEPFVCGIKFYIHTLSILYNSVLEYLWNIYIIRQILSFCSSTWAITWFGPVNIRLYLFIYTLCQSHIQELALGFAEIHTQSQANQPTIWHALRNFHYKGGCPAFDVCYNVWGWIGFEWINEGTARDEIDKQIAFISPV